MNHFKHHMAVHCIQIFLFKASLYGPNRHHLSPVNNFLDAMPGLSHLAFPTRPFESHSILPEFIFSDKAFWTML